MKNFFMAVMITLTVSCAGGGAGVLLPTDQTQTLTTPSHSFVPFATEVYDYSLASGDVTVTYGQGEYKDSSNFPSTDKYKVEDYGFFQITAQGIHDGQNRNLDEKLPPQPWDNISTIIRADLNGDDHEDFYLVEAWEGSRDDQPNSHLFAFINNGRGQFEMQKLGCIGYGDLDYKTDPNHQCGFVSHWQRPIVADFNGDGIDDFYKTSILYLSNDGVIENKSLTNLPAFQFQTYLDHPDDLVTGPWTHDNYVADADGDGDLDIFATYTDVGWAMLINDGSGVFTVNQNFAMDHRPNHWATTATIGDFDNDGYGDVAVGWFNPDEISSGAVYWNDGNNDWRNRDRTNLPANFFGTNGNANDMEVMDFNNDGFMDILLASTTHEPYYKGRVIQFFQNNGNGTFSEWNSYETSGGDSGWFQEGWLHLLDFDKDGDIDIIDSVAPTYVLINEDGNFILYDEMPTEGRLFPVEIDGKWQYDFISYEMTWAGYIEEEGKHDTSVTTFFQVLDPLTQMAKDITTKPAGYALAASENKLMFSNLRHRQLNGESDITITNNNMLGFDIEHGRLHMGMGYARNDRKANNKTVYFGAGTATIDIETYTIYAERIWKNTRFGLAYYATEVDSFHEQGSRFDVEIDLFRLRDLELFIDLRYKDFSLGISKYASIKNTVIGFHDLNYEHDHKTTMIRVSYLKIF